MMDLEIITTADGSGSLFVPHLNETYHSRKGAIAESIYVYIDKGLAYFNQPTLRVIEFGFGTGLNAYLAWQWAEKQQVKISYQSVELHPLPWDLVAQLAIPAEASLPLKTLHLAKWNSMIDLSTYFSFHKHEGSFLEATFPPADVIFYDAFAPSKQPDVWELPYLQKAFLSLQKGGMLVTYCAQGQFKRNLKSLGFEVQTLPGPLGKTEMTRAFRS